MSLFIRQLSGLDIGAAADILQMAFKRSGRWRQDLTFNRRIQPDGYFLAEQGGEPVGIVGSVIYSTYAYIGMMAVHPGCQRQGVGQSLMEHLLEWLDQRNVPLIVLDASPQGQPLYERMGFTTGRPVLILQRREGRTFHPIPHGVHAISSSDLDLITSFDRKAFGADRSRVLHALHADLPGRSFLMKNEEEHVSGYLFAQGMRMGPWVMEEEADAEDLLKAALSLPYEGPVSVAVPAENSLAESLLESKDFKTVRVNQHMWRGSAAPECRRRMVFSQVSLSLG